MQLIQRFASRTNFELYPLDEKDVYQALTRALNDDQNGLKSYQPKIDEDALKYFYSKSW